MGLFVADLCDLFWLWLLLWEPLSLFFFFPSWLCRFLPFQSILEFLLSWDYFSCLKLCAALWKPEEALFKYHSSFPGNIFIHFFFFFLAVSPIIQLWIKNATMFASTLFSRISHFSERTSCKCISDLNFPTLSSVWISVFSFVSVSIIGGRNFLGIWGGFFSNSFL